MAAGGGWEGMSTDSTLAPLIGCEMIGLPRPDPAEVVAVLYPDTEGISLTDKLLWPWL